MHPFHMIDLFSKLPEGLILFQRGPESWYWLSCLSPRLVKDEIFISVSPPPAQTESPLCSSSSNPLLKATIWLTPLTYMLRKRTQPRNSVLIPKELFSPHLPFCPHEVVFTGSLSHALPVWARESANAREGWAAACRELEGNSRGGHIFWIDQYYSP